MKRFFTEKNIWKTIAIILIGINIVATVYVSTFNAVAFQAKDFTVPMWAAVLAIGTIIILLVAVIPQLKIIETIKAWRGKQ